jgi:signal transduction histidine kinase
VTYSIAQGLATNNVLGITEDNWGRIYLGTSRGVDRLDPANGVIRHFTSADGLKSGEVTTAYRDRSGGLWFGTSQGLSRLLPEAEARSAPPDIWISGIRVGGSPMPVSELGDAKIAEIHLNPEQTQVHVDYFGMSFSPGDTLRYQYRLAHGANPEWSTASEQRGVDFANLAPGRYLFEVRALNAEGRVSGKPATAAFYILPPIWRRGWFIGSTVLVAGLIAFGLHRRRLGRLLELERVRTRIATDLHDDIGSTLSQISVLSEVACQRVGKNEEAVAPLTTIADLSRTLVDSLNDIVWVINPNRDSLADLTQRMRRFANDFVSARPLEINFRSPAVEHEVKMGPDMRREVFLIFKEGVNNAVRHSECAHVEIDFQVNDGFLELQVTDDGTGFDAARPGEGNGLWSMHRRAEKIRGELQILSIIGQGSTIRLKAPLGDRSRSHF